MFTIKVYYADGSVRMNESVIAVINKERTKVEYRVEGDNLNSVVCLGECTTPMEVCTEVDGVYTFDCTFPSSVYIENSKGKTIESVNLGIDGWNDAEAWRLDSIRRAKEDNDALMRKVAEKAKEFKRIRAKA